MVTKLLTHWPLQPPLTLILSLMPLLSKPICPPFLPPPPGPTGHHRLELIFSPNNVPVNFDAGCSNKLLVSWERKHAHRHWWTLLVTLLVRNYTFYIKINFFFLFRMDSIDVYLEKKRKRMEGFNQSVKKAKVKQLTKLHHI